MIPAARSPWFAAWFARVARGRLLGEFGRVHALGLDHLRAALERGPVLVVSNHTTWWDALVAIDLGRVCRAEGYALMDATNLRRLRFFGRTGAFGVDLADPADGARGVRYGARLLDRPGRLVWMFAQGRERPVTARPLGFHGGAAMMARLAPRAAVVPVALRFEFGDSARPTALVALGPPLETRRDVEAGRQAQEAAVAELLDELDSRLCQGTILESGESLLERRPSLRQAVLESVLGLLTATSHAREPAPPQLERPPPPAHPSRREREHEGRP